MYIYMYVSLNESVIGDRERYKAGNARIKFDSEVFDLIRVCSYSGAV